MTIQTGQLTQTRSGLGFGFARRLVLTNADILTLPTTVPVLVPAIANRSIIPLFVSFVLNPWTAALTNVDNGLTIVADVPSGLFAGLGAVPDAANLLSLLKGTDDSFDVGNLVFNISDDYSGDLEDIIGQPLGLVTSNGLVGNFTGGAAGNVLTITTYYLTIP